VSVDPRRAELNQIRSQRIVDLLAKGFMGRAILVDAIEAALRRAGVWTRSAHPCLFCGAGADDEKPCSHCAGTFDAERAEVEAKASPGIVTG